MEAVQPRLPRAAAAACLAEAAGGTSQTVQRMVNDDTHLANDRGGRATQRGAYQEEVRRTIVEGATDAPGEAGRLTQQGGVGGTPPDAPQQ